MSLYSSYILPKIVHAVCGNDSHMCQRSKVVPRAQGVVLEIGIGSGLNLPFYHANHVTKVLGLDPSIESMDIAVDTACSVSFDVEFIELPGEEIPLDTASVDTVLMTYTLCSIADTRIALQQMKRVLKPGGQLIFCEHGAAPDADIRRWQDRLNPLWSRLAGGCQLNRKIPDLLEEGGFRIRDIQTGYIPGWKPGSFNYWGSALGS